LSGDFFRTGLQFRKRSFIFQYCIVRMKLRALLVLFLITRMLAAQVVLENNPTHLRWFRVTTPNFHVLFPEGFNVQAQRMANTLEHIRDAESASLGIAPRRIFIILQNQSSVSNGFVTMFP